MFGSDILDIAVGMIFVYLLLSLVCSAVNESLESFLKMRGQMLEEGLAELLGDSAFSVGFFTKIARAIPFLKRFIPAAPANNGMLAALFNHGLIYSLFKGSYNPADKSNLPSYIPSASFAKALMDLEANPPAGVTIPAKLQTALDAMKVTAANIATDARAAQAAAVQYQANIEAWFNGSMDRVGGWYKRRSHTINLVLGFVLVIAINADSLNIATSLANNSTLRKALVASAEAQAKQPLPATGTNELVSNNVSVIKTQVQGIASLGLPVGWNLEPAQIGKNPDELRAGENWYDFSYIGRVFSLHLIGWLISGLAVSLGAPFWFDLLNKFINIRSTLKSDPIPPASPNPSA